MIHYKITNTLNKSKKILLSGICLLLLYNFSFAQAYEKNYDITWQKNSLQAQEFIFLSPKDNCPYLYISEKAGANKKLVASIKNIEYEPIDTKVLPDIKWTLVNTIEQFKKITVRKENYLSIEMPAVRKNQSPVANSDCDFHLFPLNVALETSL